jgi:GSH-dependent disulfide-bond oxidoreductase
MFKVFSQSVATTIELYTYATPNGHKASIMLEETGLPYEVHVVDIERGDQRRREFRALNPNGKIPVIVDRATGRAIFESGAILLYLAEKSGRLNPPTSEARIETLQWLFFQVGHIGPMLGQLWHFKVFAPEKIPYAIELYEREALRLFGVLDGRLADSQYLVGDYGIADIATWPWVNAFRDLGLTFDRQLNLQRWHETLATRPAVIRGLAVPKLCELSAA